MISLPVRNNAKISNILALCFKLSRILSALIRDQAENLNFLSFLTNYYITISIKSNG